LISTAMLWLGAWALWRLRERPVCGLIAAAACFVVGAGFKEYVFAMIPLGAATVIFLPKRPRWGYASAIMLMLGSCMGALLLLRGHTMPTGTGRGLNYVSFSPLRWAVDAAQIGAGLLFFGNTVWVFLHQSVAVLLSVALSIVAAAILLVDGTRRVARDDRNSPVEPTRTRWILFLVCSFALASFPANISVHMSEMYLPPVVVSLALLCGLAVEGYQQAAPRTLRQLALTAAAIALASSVVTIYQKIEGLRDVGERADRQLRQILDRIPADARNVRVALLFDGKDFNPRDTFSVYRMPDQNLLVHPMCAEWLRPGAGITLASFMLPNPEYNPEGFDLILKWDHTQQKFQTVDKKFADS
jgi:hypothetical protein